MHLLGHVEQEAGGPVRTDDGAHGGSNLASSISPHDDIVGEEAQEPVEIATPAGSHELPGQLQAVPEISVEALPAFVNVPPGA